MKRELQPIRNRLHCRQQQQKHNVHAKMMRARTRGTFHKVHDRRYILFHFSSINLLHWIGSVRIGLNHWHSVFLSSTRADANSSSRHKAENQNNTKKKYYIYKRNTNMLNVLFSIDKCMASNVQTHISTSCDKECVSLSVSFRLSLA